MSTPPAPPAGSASSSADETRLASSRPTSATGWLSSSGAIDHGRFAPGTLLGGRYRIVGRLGKGGMGEVFRADDLKLGQPVALKFLPPDVDRDPARLTQLHTEVRMARQVSHPNVCRVYDIDEVDGHTFLSMEYVDGEDLASLLRRIGRFPEERALEIARQICAGLAAAHERRVVHRDFKPANVMLDGNGQVRITDFGLAGMAGETIRAGTPAYMAPEQLAGGEVTVRSDIYALGLVLYEIFTGQRALDGKNLADLIRRREQADIVPPSMVVRGLSPEIDVAVMRCLAPAPESRPASALFVAAALPGGDPLAAALAAGETPSPAMVAAAGEAGVLSRRFGVSLLAVVMLGLIGTAVLADRLLLINRVPLEKSADVLEDRAREILRTLGYPPNRGWDQARGVGITTEQLPHLAAAGDRSRARWDFVQAGRASVLRFWHRTSPRTLVPMSPAWGPSLNDPPVAVSGMATVVVDERGRLLEMVVMPPQVDASPAPEAPVDWAVLFEAAGLPFAAFTPVEPHWTPRIYAERRAAWEGALPDAPDVRVRVEAAEYRGRAVSFHIVGPWTRAARMEQDPPTIGSRALAFGGTALLLAMIVGAVALVRHNLRSDRADREGASRIALFLMCVWTASWALGARHALESEFARFYMFLALAVLNTAVTWMFYLALEPFVRRFFPDILISWTRLVRGQFRDPLVGRDVLIGLALGVSVGLLRWTLTAVPALLGETPAAPQPSNVQYFLGVRFFVSALLRVLPNALQSAMLATFAFVMLRALVRRNWIAVVLSSGLFAGVILAESGGDELAWTLVFTALIVAPMMFVFLRFGLLSLATTLVVIQATNTVPLTADLTRPHGPLAAWVIVGICAIAAYAFHLSRAGRGMFRSVV